MRAVAIGADGAISVSERPDPVPGVGEVLVRVRAAGMNWGDLGQQQGIYPAPPGWPADIPGLEIAGEVQGIGPNVYRFSVGDAVMAVVGSGGQAELSVVHESLLMPRPATLSWEEGGGFSEAFVTAHDALMTQGRLRPGERVLITGAAGGVGVAAVQIAAVSGAEVIASVRHEDNRDNVLSLGANRVIDPAEAEANGPYDVVIELIGAPNMEANLRALRVGGRIVVIGAAGGTQAQLDLGLLGGKRAVVRGSTLRARSLAEKAIATRAVEHEVLPFVSRGEIRVPIAAVYPLEDARTAYETFTRSGRVGKQVISL
ncbi:zinc-binding dehydrogenase [Streptomyces sp. MW-W600-10]|uniref:zinc-binding dehydrogenase n=1 Tax=Streptomyces sp. MW-W600-10 TaxID=2829819 RepID=UPI001C464F3C|nr:zinc-binding dehydrogenase [Streptomyces sp. MW-W600-10]MBV7248185.1 zinc-binding dehydrogenase [Streptomyces sp. MW-W600-10]